MTNKFTQQISPKQCVGDSLPIINRNFANIEEEITDLRQIDSFDKSVSIHKTLDEQGLFKTSLRAPNTFSYFNKFDCLINAVEESTGFSDNTSLPTTIFSYVGVTSATKPHGFFSTIALNEHPPTLTLFWTASGTNDLTVYATNSSTSIIDVGETSTNSHVNCFYLKENALYIGGDFTTIGNNISYKSAVIDLSSGNIAPSLGPTGLVTTNLLTANGGLGELGSVNAFVENGDLLIVAGSFKDSSYGSGLVILDKLNEIVYPFYVNGTVNTLAVSGNFLYAGGSFNYINYGSSDSDVNFSAIQYGTNGLAKISLLHIENGFPVTSIDEDFCKNVERLFHGPATINAIGTKDDILYLGWEFTIKNESIVIAQNLFAMSNEALSATSVWFPIMDGPVYDVKIQNNVLYVCGDFLSYRTTSQIYLKTPVSYNFQDFARCVAFDISLADEPFLKETWKPKFNGPVVTILPGSNHVYCYGHFTKANETDVSYLAAIDKITGNTSEWNVFLDSPPTLNNKALLLFNNSLIIGGTFKKINTSYRNYLARVRSLEDGITTSSPYVYFDFGGQITGGGMSVVSDAANSTTVRVKTKPNKYGIVNRTVFPFLENEFKYIQPGQLCKFFIRRPGKNENLGQFPSGDDTFTQSIKIIGWTVNFNKL